jgi:hypothetical protein
VEVRSDANRTLPLVILAFRAVPPGKTAIETPVAIAVRAFFLRCQDQHAPGPVAVDAATAFAMTAQGRFVRFFMFRHG